MILSETGTSQLIVNENKFFEDIVSKISNRKSFLTFF